MELTFLDILHRWVEEKYPVRNTSNAGWQDVKIANGRITVAGLIYGEINGQIVTFYSNAWVMSPHTKKTVFLDLADPKFFETLETLLNQVLEHYGK